MRCASVRLLSLLYRFRSIDDIFRWSIASMELPQGTSFGRTTPRGLSEAPFYFRYRLTESKISRRRRNGVRRRQSKHKKRGGKGFTWKEEKHQGTPVEEESHETRNVDIRGAGCRLHHGTRQHSRGKNEEKNSKAKSEVEDTGSLDFGTR